MNLVDDILEILHERGERLTIQRRMVVEALCRQSGHRTLHELREAIRQIGEDLDESTIYRILQWLNTIGLVSQTDLGERGTVYELLYGKPHHHLVCLSCGLTIELDDNFAQAMRGQLREQYHFQPRVDHMAIFGWCEDCQKKHLAQQAITS